MENKLTMSVVVESKYLKITLLLVSTLTVMSGALIAPALPAMADAFAGAARAALLTKLVLTMPGLFIALGSPLAGALVDRWGRLRLLLLSMGLYALAGGAGLVLDSLYLLLMSRALLGVAVAFIMTIVTTLVGDYLEGEERAGFLGIQGGFMAFGGTVFIALSGLLSDGSWRYPFALYLLSIPFMLLVVRNLYEPTPSSSPTEPPPPAAGQAWRVYGPVYLTAFLGMVLFYLAPAQLPFLMETIGVNSALAGSLGLVVITLTAAICSLNYRRIRLHLSFHQIYALLFILMAIGFGAVYWMHAYVAVVLAMGVAGMGAGLLLPNTSLYLITAAPPRVRGRVLGGMTSAIFLGQFFSPLVAEPILQAFSIFDLYLFGSLLALAIGFTYAAFALRRHRLRIRQKAWAQRQS